MTTKRKSRVLSDKNLADHQVRQLFLSEKLMIINQIITRCDTAREIAEAQGLVSLWLV